MELFTTNDVYRIMNTALMEKNYPLLGIEEKRKVVTECFANYFIYKLVQLSDKLGNNLENLSLEELFALIEEKIPNEKCIDILSHPIHYLLSIISCLQNFEVIWEIDENAKQANIITNDEGKFDKFVTSSHPVMSLAFENVYQYFMKCLRGYYSSMHYNLLRENKEK